MQTVETMKTLAYYNGVIDTIEDMRVPMNDRACWFGDCVYDATASANHVIFALDEHIERFFNSASLVRIALTHTKTELADLLSSLVKRVEGVSHFVYWQATRGTAPRAHTFPDTPSNLWVTIRPLVMPDLTKPRKLITVEDTRFLHCNIKTLNLLPNVLASELAKEAGCDEAVFHRGERVTECAHSNVHILKNGVFRTAPTDNLILPGIARTHLIICCRALGIGVEENPFTVKEMMDADEVIVSSSSVFCSFASHIDGHAVGGKAPELLCKMRDYLTAEFRAATSGSPVA
jgi:D-alanine transaminase